MSSDFFCDLIDEISSLSHKAARREVQKKAERILENKNRSYERLRQHLRGFDVAYQAYMQTHGTTTSKDTLTLMKGLYSRVIAHEAEVLEKRDLTAITTEENLLLHHSLLERPQISKV